MPKKTICLEVPRTEGEKTLNTANRLGIIDKSLQIQKDTTHIHIPLSRQPNENELAIIKAQVPSAELAKKLFQEKTRQDTTLAEALENQLPPHLIASLPRALDVVGDIAIIEIPPELRAQEDLVGEAILKTHKNVRTVLAKASAISGTYRLREFNLIAGEQKTETIHKEHGCRFYVDVEKVYFSPRLSHEHRRVAALVRNGENMVDLFAGVGPFSILAAKNNPETKVYAVDINPEAFELLKRNIRLNRVENRVLPILGDARQTAEGTFAGVADHVVMNLPEKAIEFVDAACTALKPAGGTVHFYGFLRHPDTIGNMQLRFSEAVEKAGRKVTAVLFAKTIRETAPYEGQVALDAEIR